MTKVIMNRLHRLLFFTLGFFEPQTVELYRTQNPLHCKNEIIMEISVAILKLSIGFIPSHLGQILSAVLMYYFV